MGIWLRSLFSWMAWVLLTLFLGPVVWAVAVVDRGSSWRVSRAWARLLLRVSGVNVEVRGMENIDPSRAAVYVANHHSYVDVISLIARLGVDVIFVAKTTLLVLPGVNLAMLGQGHIFVPRDRHLAALKILRRKGMEYLKAGRSVLIFPEGGRSRDDTVGDFKSGAAALAIWAGLPVVPIGIAGSRDVLPRGNWPLRPGRVIISVGEPIATGHSNIKQRAEITSSAERRVAKLKEEADRKIEEKQQLNS